MKRGLWITRTLPFPLDTGDRIYSAQLIRATAEAGADLTVVGFAPPPATAPPAGWPVRWRSVEGAPHGSLRALASPMPLVAAAHATAAYRRELALLAAQPWDFVVFDQYGTGWALPLFLRRRPAGAALPALVHVAHDHEVSVYASLVANFHGSPVRRLALWQNSLKIRAFERRIARRVDLLTAITREDAGRFAADAPDTASVVLTPGYGGPVSARAGIAPETPRNVVMVGNYHWVAKSENLRQFVRAADEEFCRHGITLHVIGSMPAWLAQDIQASTRATVLHGFVQDMGPHLRDARIAVVPEEIGGGFKLKFLDYVFNRVPVASLSHATAGLPEALRAAMLCRNTLPQLVRGIVDHIGQDGMLTSMQHKALEVASQRYRWSDRGHALLEAIERRRPRSAGSARPFKPSQQTTS